MKSNFVVMSSAIAAVVLSLGSLAFSGKTETKTEQVTGAKNAQGCVISDEPGKGDVPACAGGQTTLCFDASWGCFTPPPTKGKGKGTKK